jgi:hypothetical protein
MKVRGNSCARVCVFVLAGGLIVLAAGAVKAATEPDFTYSQPQTGHLQLPTPAFAPITSTAAWSQDGRDLSPSANTNTCFLAAVNLPEQSRIVRVSFWYLRETGTAYSVQLFRNRVADGTIQPLINAAPAVSSTRTGMNAAIATPALRVVDNLRYSYMMLVCTDSALNSFGGARITYSYTDAGD